MRSGIGKMMHAHGSSRERQSPRTNLHPGLRSVSSAGTLPMPSLPDNHDWFCQRCHAYAHHHQCHQWCHRLERGSSGRYANAETDSSKDSDTTTEAEESPLAVGTVFTGFECEVPKAPAGTAWYPHGQGSYILEEQEIPPPEEVPPPDDEFRSLIHLLRIQKESSRLIAQWCVEKWKS